MWIKRGYILQDEADDGTGGSTGGAAAPTEPAGELPEASGDDSVNWAEFDSGFDSDESDVEGDLEVVGSGSESQASQPNQSPVATPTVTPAATPPAAGTPPAAPAATQPVAPAQSAPPPQTQAPAPAAASVEPAVYQTWRDARIGELEQHYTFSEDESAALLTEPEMVLPKLAARVHMEVLENSMRAMQAMVPVMMEQIKHHTEVNTGAKNLFTSINPDLADPAYEPAILQLGQTFRQMNKTASAEEASRAIGNLVRAALGMQQGGMAPQATPPARPAAPAPFVPMRGGGGGNIPTSNNPFEQLASEMLSEDSW